MSFCRITGKSRALPKPNYFPLLPPISPADAKRFCRITGKAYGLPSHHYIPVILTTLSGRNKCKITNVSGELGPHHYMPDISYGKRKHIVSADYRYFFPTLDETDDLQKGLMDLLNSKNIPDEGRYVYKVDERKCSLVFSAKLEQAVRDGDVRDVMLAKDCDSVLLKMRQGKNVSVDLQEYDEEKEQTYELFEGEGPRHEVILEREREEAATMKRRKTKRIDLSDRARIFEDKERLQEEQLEEYEDHLHRSLKRKKLEQMKKTSKQYYKVNMYLKTDVQQARESLYLALSDSNDLVKPVIESWDWDTYEKEIVNSNVNPISKQLPKPRKLKAISVVPHDIEIPTELIENTIGFDCIPCIGPLQPIRDQPSAEVLQGIRELPEEKLEPLLDLQTKIMEERELSIVIPTPDEIPSCIKNIPNGVVEEICKVPGLRVDIGATRKVFLTGQQVQTPNGEVFVPGQAVSTPQGAVYVPGLTMNTPNGPLFIPGQIITPKDNPNSPIFMAGQMIDEVFVPGQTFKVGSSPKFVEGQTVTTVEGFKFVPGVIDKQSDTFIVGQKLTTPDGIRFIPGQTVTTDEGNKFVAGQNVFSEDTKSWEFIPGQMVKTDEVEEFVPGKTIMTDEGAKFVPGQHVGDVFVPGITVETNMGLEFVPGLNVETKQGPKFIEGQVVNSKQGQIFMPGKTIFHEEIGEIEFAVAKSVNDVVFNDPTGTGYVIDVNSTEVSNQCLSVYGHMVQTKNGIEFYPEKIDINHLPQGKRIPGKLIRRDTDTKFVPGIIENGGFIPGQVVWTEKGEQFIPGQVIETSEGLKFVPGQVIETKNGSKFVPGQTIETPDGPRFVPGQIVHTKAGPTFIPGQVINTGEEGERFVPGQVVDTEDGPRFVPGRVIETDDKVTFIPGQIVQTSEGPKFVAPDLTDNEFGEQQFSVQSFLVSPEELTLLKPTHTWNQTSSTKGELSIDSQMLRQLSAAGMTIGRQIEASAVDIVLQSTKNIQTIKQLIQKLGIGPDHCDIFLQFFKDVEKIAAELIINKQTISNGLGTSQSGMLLSNGFHKQQNGHAHTNGHANGHMNGHTNGYANGHGSMNGDSDDENQLVDVVISTILSATKLYHDKVADKNNNNRQFNSSIFELLSEAFEQNVVHMDIHTIENILNSAKTKESVLKSVQGTVAMYKKENSKLEILNYLIHKKILNEGEITAKIASIIDDADLNQAFITMTEEDPKLLYKILNKVRENSQQINCEETVGDILQKTIISAVKDLSEGEIRNMFMKDRNEVAIQNLLTESLALLKALGLSEHSIVLNEVLAGRKSVAAVFENPDLIEVVKRTLIINKLAKNNPEMRQSLKSLISDPYQARKDSNIRQLIRQSGVVTIIPEEKIQINDSHDVPMSFFCNDNMLAMEDFLLRRQTKNKGAFLIVKEGLQAVVPRESSRDVLTGKCAYTVLDENGIRHFEPLHVFSALKLNTPSMAHRFSIYSCDFATDDIEIDSLFTSCSSLSGGDLKVTTLINNELFAAKERIPKENTELLATRRKIRALLNEGKVYPHV